MHNLPPKVQQLYFSTYCTIDLSLVKATKTVTERLTMAQRVIRSTRRMVRQLASRRGIVGGCSSQHTRLWQDHRQTLSTAAPRSSAPSSLSTPTPALLSQSQKQQFWEDGFVRVDNVLPPDLTVAVRDRFDRLFRGDFSTGVFPDEWHWREGISLPDATREIVNAWKTDHVVASVVLSPEIGRMVADLMGWRSGTRIGQDDALWKPPGAGGVAFHQDSVCVFVSHSSLYSTR